MTTWLLSEAVANARLGTIVSWRTPTGLNMGTVIGTDAQTLTAVTMVDKSLDHEAGEKLYLDPKLTARLGSLPGLPRVHIDVHVVPKSRATLVTRIKGRALKPYVTMSRALHKPQRVRESVTGGVYGEAVAELERVFNG